MAKQPWTKFFWADWESDPALKLCSLAAQGLWMRMLCIAASHDPIGIVAVAGRGLDEADIARMTGASNPEVVTLLGELTRNGVLSRDSQQRIYSRRMVRDARKAKIARKNGKMGGNPSLCKSTEKTASVNPPDIPRDKGGDNTQKPEARDSVTTVTGGQPPPDDPVKRVFDAGVALLTSAGSTAKQARSAVGRWRKTHGDDWTMQAMTAAREQSIAEPIAWIEARGRAVVGQAEARSVAVQTSLDRHRELMAAANLPAFLTE